VNVEHVLKTNFTNYPKVNDLNSLMFGLRKSELKAESNVPEHRVGNRVQILHGRAPR
jgi:hypothetical protein